MSTIVVRPTLARLAGAAWLGTGLVLVASALLGLVQAGTPGWQLPVALAALIGGWWTWQRTLAVDDLGIEQQVGLRRARLLWSVVDTVEVDAGFVGPVRVRLAGRDDLVDLAASWGTTRRQREDLHAVLARTAEPFGVEVTGG